MESMPVSIPSGCHTASQINVGKYSEIRLLAVISTHKHRVPHSAAPTNTRLTPHYFTFIFLLASDHDHFVTLLKQETQHELVGMYVSRSLVCVIQ